MNRLLSESDRPQVMEYMLRHEAEMVFPYANITLFGIENDPNLRRCGDYHGYFEDGALRGVLPFFNLGSCNPHFESENAIPEFVELLRATQFKMLLGRKKYAQPLYEAIKDIKPASEYDDLYYYINHDFKPYLSDSVTFIDADGKSGDDIVDFIVEARNKGFGQTVSNAYIRDSLIQKNDDEDFILSMVDGKYVATGSVNAYTPSFGQIAGVYTSEDERGKGYCKATVSELCHRIIAKGKTPMLSVVKENTPAIRAYQALGFEYIDDYLIIKLQS